MALTEKYMANFSEEDFLQYQFMSAYSEHDHFDASTLKNSFMNILVLFISHNILYHECGHILLGHCDGKMVKMVEQHNSGSMRGGYGLQAREMLADWYGIKKTMNVFLFSFAQTCGYKITNNSDLLIFRKALFLALVALYCQFDLFEATNNHNKNGFSEYTLEHRTRLHPYIRLFHSCDAMKEAAMDVIEIYNQADPNLSEHIVSELLKTVIDDLLCFLEKMGLINIRFDTFRTELIECHYLIRKRAAFKKHSTKPYINFEIQKMPEQYLVALRSLKNP